MILGAAAAALSCSRNSSSPSLISVAEGAPFDFCYEQLERADANANDQLTSEELLIERLVEAPTRELTNRLSRVTAAQAGWKGIEV